MSHAPPYKFTLVRELDGGYDLDARSKQVWPRYGDVHLRVEPLPRGRGLEFINLPRAMPDHRTARLPDWAVGHAELGALHALLVGGPGGLPITDVRVKLLSGGWHEHDSGERAFFLAAYLAVRKVIHRAVLECPCFLEYVERAAFRIPASDERAAVKELQKRRASGILSRKVVAGINGGASMRDMIDVEADVPAALQDDLDLALSRLDPVFKRAVPEIHWTAVGYRSRETTDVPRLLREFGPPRDWPEPGDDDPRLGGDFPALPVPVRDQLRDNSTSMRDDLPWSATA
ncbi:MAG: hypothetical protein AB7K09_00580 [Planctomycetota bacterium]